MNTNNFNPKQAPDDGGGGGNPAETVRPGLPDLDNPPVGPTFVGKVTAQKLTPFRATDDLTGPDPMPPDADLPDKLPPATTLPPNVTVLYGYLGELFDYADPANDNRPYVRLYRSILLNEYLEILTTDIYYVELLQQFNAISLNVMWVRPEAQMRYVYTATVQAQQASFLQGPIAGGQPGGYGWSGGGGGGTSFACPGGGTSFACPGGGTSFACPGGGTSFACPGGGTSFACPGGGTSFACPGGGTSFACPGGGVSFGWCR